MFQHNWYITLNDLQVKSHVFFEVKISICTIKAFKRNFQKSPCIGRSRENLKNLLLRSKNNCSCDGIWITLSFAILLFYFTCVPIISPQFVPAVCKLCYRYNSNFTYEVLKFNYFSKRLESLNFRTVLIIIGALSSLFLN